MLTLSDECTLHALLEKVSQKSNNFLGFPVSKDFDYLQLMPFLQYPLNNLGDPFVESTYGVDTREIEKEVIHFFADLFRAEPDNYWGYVTNGGSEGNLYGLYLARELYPKAMIYYSAATHYSVQKNIHLLNMPSIVIKTQPSGEMDYTDFLATLNMNRHLPAIVLANIGTTMTEARDNVGRIKKILKENAIQQHYIHADGALSGGYSAFIEPRPSFDFQDGSDSIAISGHKFFGAPFPLGLVLVKKNNRDRIAKAVSYIGSSDTTITGSRNGLSPLILWYSIKRWGVEGLKKRVTHSLEIAAYTQNELNKIGINAWRNPNSFTVVFPTPKKAIKDKWQLASEDGMSHIICMPNVNKSQIDAFINDVLNGITNPQQSAELFLAERGGCLL
ncbi:MAG TPA: histidine decarboxylase [Bacteroidia bacterium]|nr:histidine decarboxylase [Bacteroidia bacterium]